jgi:glycosyltransferase involved in cell wall biosynthesis
MRLLQLCTHFEGGGISRHVIDLSAAMRTQGHYVAIAGTRGKWMSEKIDADFFFIDLDNVAEAGGSIPRRLVAALRGGMALRRVLKAQRVEMIHAHESAPALVARIAVMGTGIPVYVTFHGAEPGRIAQFGQIARFSADRVLTPSHNSARDLREIGGVPPDRLQVMGLGVQRKPDSDAERVAAIRSELLGEGGRVLIVTIARLERQKGIDLLVEAARRSIARDPGLRFVVVGDGPQREEARVWAAEAGIADKLTLVGHSDEVQAYLAAADIFFLPSRWESLPISIVEAFQRGLPVVATDTAGVEELVDETVGRLVPVGDVDAMVEALAELAGDAALRARLSDAALQRSHEDRFSPAHVHACFEQLYREALGESKAAG